MAKSPTVQRRPTRAPERSEFVVILEILAQTRLVVHALGRGRLWPIKEQQQLLATVAVPA